MTVLASGRVRPICVDFGLWSVSGAAAPTLAVSSSRRFADPLPVLETAVAIIGRSVVKVALAHPAAADPAAHAEYVFAQVAERCGSRMLDLTPECGHSMLATATHLHAGGRIQTGRVPLRLLTHRSGTRRIVECEVRSLDPRTGVYEAGLGFPLDDRDGDFPMGKVPIALDIGGVPVPVTVVDSGNPYAFVDGNSLGITSGEEVMTAGERARALLMESVLNWLPG